MEIVELGPTSSSRQVPKTAYSTPAASAVKRPASRWRAGERGVRNRLRHEHRPDGEPGEQVAHRGTTARSAAATA